MRKKLLVSLFTLLAIFLLIPSRVHAQCAVTFPGGLGSIGCKVNANLDSPAGIISAVVPNVLTVLGFLTVIMIVISGIQFITSSGNPEAAAGARGRLTYAIVGFVLIVLAYAILQIVNRLFLNTLIA